MRTRCDQMKFYVGKREYKILERPVTTETRCFYLLKNDWDDFGTTSTFYLEYKDDNSLIHDLGTVKILQRNQKNTTFPDSPFDELGPDYISLGQNLRFYENLLTVCGQEMAIQLLEALRDIAWSPILAESYETMHSFRNSLLRDNSTDRARLYGRRIIDGEIFHETFSFNYAGTIPGASEPTIIHVAFDDADPVPGRIVGIIGRNAVGKTQYLAQLAQDLVHTKITSKDALDGRIRRFDGLRPVFSRIITISYSAFDCFPRPQNEHASYIYCGIRNKDGKISKTHLLQTYRANLDRVRGHNRENLWVNFMQYILGIDGTALREKRLQKEISASQANIPDDELSILSSGQAILVSLITSLLAWIEPKSLVLFDEPETHLHPNAVASLFNVFNLILKEFDSFALLATHSPLVIQEIPSSRVIVFERVDNVTEAKGLAGETFGENLSDLTRHIFETFGVPSFYKRTLDELSKNMSYDEVLAYFPKGLSINARSYLLSRYPEVPN